MQQDSITVAMVSYRKPIMREETIKALYRNPGREFTFLEHNNDKRNIGSSALRLLFKKTKTTYFVVVEDDMLWFQDGWLEDLVKGMEKGWRLLSTNSMGDGCNGLSHNYSNLEQVEIDGVWYVFTTPGGGPFIFRTSDGNFFPKKTKRPNQALYTLITAYKGLPMGKIRDTYMYHAAGPYWGQLYPEVFEKKGDKLKDAIKLSKLNFDNKEPMDALLSGNFEQYAKDLYNRK